MPKRRQIIIIAGPFVAGSMLEVQDTLRALRRAARRALELGLKTGTPVYVVENGKIIDLTKRKRTGTKAKTTKTPNPDHNALHVNFIKYLRHTKTPDPNNTPSPQICKVLIKKLRQ